MKAHWLLRPLLYLALPLLLCAAMPLWQMPLAHDDADRLIFFSDSDTIDAGRGSNSVYGIGLDGRGQKRIAGSIKHGADYLRISDVDCQSASRLIAIATNDSTLNGFHLVEVAGTGLRHFTPLGEPLMAIRQLSLSPDGSRIVVSRVWDDSPAARYGLLIGDLRSAEFVVFMPPGDSRSISAPAWSPDGQRIAYVVEEAGKHRIAMATPDENDKSSEKVIHTTTRRIGRLAWSPDSLWLAAEMNGQIIKMRRDGSKFTRLSSGLGGAWSPQWSRDGGRIAFASRSSFPGTVQLLTMSAKGDDAQRVTALRGELALGCWLG
ncbi:MAG: LpqB family beta-propeller domain-containing protein [Chloroflexi bacterium]|nr:LpqB family beta-propeller domain-containing protein [Chloroflexota bacterium]